MSPTNTAKDEITISLDVEALKAPVIQKKQLTMILMSLLLMTNLLMTGLMLLTVKKILRKSHLKMT